MAARSLYQNLEVKVDTREPRNRLTSPFPNAKNWTRFEVQVEAIQCFPCYVKVTLSKAHPESGQNPPLILRITIPGLHVQLAASRTKPHCYGLFWKSNRKRCSIFLAFPSDQDRCLHMNWLKEAIQDLERYRQDFLEIRRTSRCSTEIVTDPQVRFTDVWSNYQNLGPLPPVPPNTAQEPSLSQLDWSRRQSAVSGIYEEIPDPQVALRRGAAQTPERNVDEIYERLYRRRSNTVTQSLLAQTPPPLPPRPRINTLERGGEDNNTLKKKKYKSVLESIFGKHSHSRKGSESSSDDPQSSIRQKFDVDLLTHHLQGNLEKNKRHSMSTPELANWDAALDHPPRKRQEDEEVDVSEWQDVSCMSLLSESLDISAELNISDKIRPNYNLSMNASTVNLVGCNFNAVRESEIGLRDDNDGEKKRRRSLNSVNGYCVMKPIPSQSPSEEEGVHVLLPITDAAEKSSGYCPMGPLGFDREHVRCLDQQPVRAIVFNEERVKLLDSLKNVTLTRGSSGDDDEDAEAAEKRFEDEECFLRRKVMTTTPKRGPLNSQRDEDLYENCRDRRSSRGSKYLVDDKLPSYFPNASPPQSTQTTTTTANITTPTNQITPPKLVPKQRSRSSMTPSPRMQHYSPRAVPNIYSVPRNNSPVLMDNARDTEMLKQSLTDSISKLSLNSPATSPAPGRPSSKRREPDGEARSRGGSPARIIEGSSPEKNRFDNIQSPVSHKYLDKCSLKAEFANLKKFASLPRFRKLDLSPLRIKLNSVLHRNNSEF